ncbi:GAF domain-containing protein [Umezakia ovalisporum]|uniref:GAF domain-containing protein n=1 Tax=Umezakia ovalisporum TaxID=75695 RepID=UPI0035BB5342
MNPEANNYEAARLEVLRQYQILDTEPEEAYDNLVQLAAFICGTPIALVNFIDENRQWFKAKLGVDAREMPRNVGLSYLCQERRNVVIVSDALADPKLATNPVVTSYPYVRFYAGVPLITMKGYMLGTLCVIDKVPRQLSQQQVEALVALSRLVINQLELRRNISQVSRISEELITHEQAANSRINNILESITDAFFALDQEWRFTYINGQAEQLLQKSKNELLGENIWEVLPAMVDTKFACEYHRAIAKQVSVEFEEFYPPFQRWFSVHAYPSRDGLSVYFQDITEKHQTAAALRQSEERWQLALQGNNDGIWDWNVKTNEVFFSTRWKEMLGYEDHEISDHWDEWQKRVHPDDLKSVLQAFENHFAKKTPFYVTEHRILCKDGGYKWILDRGQALWDENGDVVRMLGSHTDIAERKRVEEELKRQNLRSQLFADITLKIRESLQLEEILQTTVHEVQKLLQADRVLMFQVWADGSGTVVQEAVLPAWPVALGQDIFDPCFQEQGYVEKYRQGRVSAIVDIEESDIQDCYRQFLQNLGVKANLVVPIMVRGNLWGLLIAHQCAAPRHWNSFELDLLQQIANQIGIALSQAQLLEQEIRHTQELARSNAELEQFAYVASHDLQEPLRMVTSYLQLLERKYKDKLDANAKLFINYAVDGAERMQNLINDLLNYSRVTTRGKPMVEVDFQKIFEGAIANLKVAIEECGAIITHDPLPVVMADPSQLTQVLQNLIANAIKFRGELPLKIHVGAVKAEHTDDQLTTTQSPAPTTPNQWLFSVSDNGIGIESQYAERIFIIFQRLHGRTKYPGTGIGLAICKKIIERHGGGIWVESKPGQGSTFYFTIPEKSGKKS